MEYLMTAALLAAVGSLLAVNFAAALLILRSMKDPHLSAGDGVWEESPEEAEARRAAAEAQRLYEQGFVNLMSYDGSPAGKERDGR